jgi:hypothetical protein
MPTGPGQNHPGVISLQRLENSGVERRTCDRSAPRGAPVGSAIPAWLFSTKSMPLRRGWGARTGSWLAGEAEKATLPTGGKGTALPSRATN